MNRLLRLLLAACCSAAFCSCASGPSSAYANLQVRKAGTCVYKVKTTAYCHQEADSLRYGRGTASGNTLKFGTVRSAAADWSVFPVGTIFRIQGEKHYYQVDDYGRALVGTKTIDLYRPNKKEMANSGSRNVNIEVLRWGSYSKSLDILKPRTRHAHVLSMVRNIMKKAEKS